MPTPDIPPLKISYNVRAGQSFVLAAQRAGATKRFVVPQKFTVSGARADIGVVMTVETDTSGVSRCIALELRELEGGEPVTGGVLRKIPVQEMMREALALVAGEVQSQGGGVTSAGFGSGRAAGFDENVRRPRRGAAVTDDQLRQVADLYRAALDRGDPPTQTIADEMHAARSTAARWVAKARAAGFLGAAVRGRAGEEQS